MSITNNARMYFEIEDKRSMLAKSRKFAELKKTYNHPIELINNNNGKFWDEKFSSSHEKNLTNYMELDRNRIACKWFEESLTQGSRTLNVGCGDGNFEKEISGIHKKFMHTGLDLATKSLEKLKTKYKKFSFNKKDILDDVTDAEREAYQIITMFEVLEHISPRDTFRALKNVHMMLEPYGKFIISVPMNEGLEKMFPRNPNEHLRCYTTELISIELEIAGFKVVKHKLLYAFSTYYDIKKLIATYLLKNKWQPNNIILLCEKL